MASRIPERPPKPSARNPVETAQLAGLTYVDEETSGITRKRCGRGFTYFGPSGERVREPQLLDRVRSLVIPPAWQEVWIALASDGHIQATGRDARGRKQYLYHPKWQEVRNQNKFNRLALFGRRLPAMRQRVEQDLARRGMPKERALAFVVRLLDITLKRIGNPEYARLNDSYGLSTLREQHVRICGSRLHLNFPGKRQKPQQVDVHDRHLVHLARKFQELPGQELVRFVNGDGTVTTVESADVNAYLMAISEENFTAKEFRTWGATVLTAAELFRNGPAGSQKAGLQNVTKAIRKTARRLGNTLAICRKYYVHPAVVESYLCGDLPRLWAAAERLDDTPAGLSQEEKTVMILLRDHLDDLADYR